VSFVNLNVEYEGALAGLRSKKRLLEEALLATVQDLGTQLLTLVQGNLSGPVLSAQTGDLLASVEQQAAMFVEAVCMTSVGIPDDSPEWIIGMTHEYGGTGYYDIYPINGKALAFTGEAGETVFSRHINHPPAAERSWLRSALDDIEADAVEQIKTTIAEVLAA